MCEQKKNGLVEKTYEQLFLLTTAAKIDQCWVWTNEKKKKKCSRQNIWTTFPLNINWGICLSKNKKKKKKKELRHCLVFFFFGHLIFVTHHLSLITLKYHVCLAPSLTSHHSIFFTLFVWSPGAAFSFFSFAPKLTEPREKKKNKNWAANLGEEKKNNNK